MLLRYIDQSWSISRSVVIISHSFDELGHFTSRYYFRPDCKTSDHTCNNVNSSIGNKNKIETLGTRKYNTLSIHFYHLTSVTTFIIWLFQTEIFQFESFQFKKLTICVDFNEFKSNLEQFTNFNCLILNAIDWKM